MTDAMLATKDEVGARLAIVRERYGARLTPEQLEGVRKAVEGIVEMARSLRAVSLENSDEPMQPFVPFRTNG